MVKITKVDISLIVVLILLVLVQFISNMIHRNNHQMIDRSKNELINIIVNSISLLIGIYYTMRDSEHRMFWILVIMFDTTYFVLQTLKRFDVIDIKRTELMNVQDIGIAVIILYLFMITYLSK